MELIDFEQYEKDDNERNQTWQNNQVLITKTIDLLVRKLERLPSQIEIAEECGLSRRTVNVHLREFKRLQVVVEDVAQFEFMASKVLGKVMQKAMEGHIGATRLSLQVMGLLGRQGVKKAQQ